MKTSRLDGIKIMDRTFTSFESNYAPDHELSNKKPENRHVLLLDLKYISIKETLVL